MLTRIMLPLVRPGLIVAGTFAAIFIWNELLVGSYLFQSQGLKTIPLAARGLIGAQRPIDWNVAATVSVVTIPTNCVFDGRDLIMTDAGVIAEGADASYGGQLWRLPLDTQGLPTSFGRIS